VRSARERILKKKEEAERKEQERQERTRKEEAEKLKLKSALRVRKEFLGVVCCLRVYYQQRNLVIFNKPGGSINPVSPHFDPEDPTGSTLILPVFFLYPQHATSDIISDFIENTTFAAHIEAMFPPLTPPPEWDKKGEYVAGSLVIYAPTYRRRLLKVGKKMTLRDVCEAAGPAHGQPMDGLEMKDGCLSFVVIPKGEVEQKWIEEYKKTRENS
jgi:small subunit ribosomal protein S7e